jgi:hypothetical protein
MVIPLNPMSLNYKVFITVFCFMLLSSLNCIEAQRVGINTQNPDSSAVLDVYSTQGGLLPPRLTTQERNAIANPASGLILFNTSTQCLEVYFAGVGWSAFACNCTAPPPAPMSVQGPTEVCSGQQASYKVTPVSGAQSYQWTVPAGYSILSGAGTDSIVVQIGSSSGTVSVVAVNPCGSSSAFVSPIQIVVPNASFTLSPSSASVGFPTTFSSSAVGSPQHFWVFTSATPATSNQSSPSATWSSAGTYTVSHTLIYGPGCSDSTAQSITVVNCPPGSQTFSFSGSVQTFTVPSCVTQITVEAWGAEGGASTSQNGSGLRPGGRGAYIRGTFPVTGGQQISVQVGGQGTNWTCGSGGGGGSFVVSGGQLLIAAGGGGGGFHCNALGGVNGGDGQSGNNATGGNCTPGRSPAAGGINGNGGTAYFGSGGMGWLSAGTSSTGGGTGTYPSNGASPGGGYGGGGQYYNGCCGGSGGGGGYSGGSGGTSDGCAGGGGGSFNSGTNQTNTSGLRQGNGQVIISW